jgi:hypothetical protein
MLEDVVASLQRLTPSELDTAIAAVKAGKVGKVSQSITVRGNVASVTKNVTAVLTAIHKMLDAGEVIHFETWEQIEEDLRKLSLESYKKNALNTEYVPRSSKGGRPKGSGKVEVTSAPTKGRGRPKGSTNKAKGVAEVTEITSAPKKRGRPAKVKATVEVTAAPAKGRGRPKGSTNKPKAVEAVAEITSAPTKGRGRPKGSTNKTKAVASTEVTSAPAKGRGRPKGSTNKPKGVVEVAESAQTDEGIPTFEEWQKAQGNAPVSKRRGRPAKIAA